MSRLEHRPASRRRGAGAGRGRAGLSLPPSRPCCGSERARKRIAQKPGRPKARPEWENVVRAAGASVCGAVARPGGCGAYSNLRTTPICRGQRGWLAAVGALIRWNRVQGWLR
jgi:hypothetical protein